MAQSSGLPEAQSAKEPGIEIERRFLIAIPGEDFLARTECSHISQTYLLGEPGCTERVRKRSRGDETQYFHTLKRRIAGIRREENERQIDREEYEALIKRADPRRRTIDKRRCCMEYRGKLLELDLFPFWQDRAILEIELSHEEERFELPPELKIYKEISLDKRYTNAAMALEVPMEQL